MFDAFMFYNDGRDASDYFNDLEQPLEVARTALLIVTMLTGDVVLVRAFSALHDIRAEYRKRRYIAHGSCGAGDPGS